RLRDAAHPAPRSAVHRNRPPEWGPIAGGSHALGNVGGQHTRGGQVGDDRVPGADHLADVALVERAQPQVLDVGGIEAAVGDEPERLGDAVEAEHAAEVDAGDV